MSLGGCALDAEPEPVLAVDQPDWSNTPVFAAEFPSVYPDEYNCDKYDDNCPTEFANYNAVGGGRYFHSSPLAGVRVYDAQTRVLQGYLGAIEPRGIAYYRGEVFVVDAWDDSIRVFDPVTLNQKRVLKPQVQIWASPIALDAAWNELWVTSSGNHGGGGIVVLDAQTGALKGAMYHLPRYDCAKDPMKIASGTHYHVCQGDETADVAGIYGCPETTTGTCDAQTYAAEVVGATWPDVGWKDIATVPERNGVMAGCRFIDRGTLTSPTPTENVSVTELLGNGGCANEGDQFGIDAPWGMRWLLTTDSNGSVREYGLDETSENGVVGPLRRHSSMTCSLWRTTSCDVAYQTRETRVDWSGPLTKHDWMRGTKCVDYVVSDADIYIAGDVNRQYYEPARGFQKIEFTIDGGSTQTRTTPTGQFCQDLNGVPTGTHTVRLKAYVNNGTKVATVTNSALNVDHDVPGSSLTSPGDIVTGPVTVTGTMVDPHSGSQDWSLEAILAGGAWKTVCTVPGTDNTTNQWNPQCLWDAGGPGYPEGVYQLRARASDMVTAANGGSNVAYTAPITVRVDKTPPSADVTGPLKDAEDLRTLFEDEAPAVTIAATDNPGAGVKRIEFYVDSVQKDFGEQACPGGNCAMQRTFVLRPGDYGDGTHTVTVRVIDQAGHSRDWQWDVDVERVLAPDPEGTDLPPAGMEDDGVNPAPAEGTSAMATPAPFANATVETPIPSDELLPCSDDPNAANFPVYSIGPAFESLPVTFSYRRCDVPWPEEVERANFVSFIYGDCSLPEGSDDSGGCAAPLEVQSWPACERNLASYQALTDFDPIPRTDLQISGVPGASFDDGFRVEVFTGRTTVVIFGQDAAQVLRAANSLQAQPESQPLSLPVGLRKTTRSSPLPDPIPGIVQGDVSCI